MLVMTKGSIRSVASVSTRRRNSLINVSAFQSAGTLKVAVSSLRVVIPQVYAPSSLGARPVRPWIRGGYGEGMGKNKVRTNGYFIPATGEIRRHEQDRMTEVGELVGARTGLFDVVRSDIDGKAVLLWVDDTGLIDGRPINPFASIVAQRPLYGDVFVTGDEDYDGWVLDLDFDSFDIFLMAVKCLIAAEP